MTRFYRADFESDASPALLIFCGIILALSSMSIGAVLGFEWRDKIQREIDAHPKPRPVATNPPPFLIGCDRPAVEEVSRLCRARLRSGRVGQ
jgi:hypothetical protein